MFAHQMPRLLGAIGALLYCGNVVGAINLNVDDPSSIKSAASTLAYDMMKLYIGNETGQVPGLLPQPYYWWEAGAMFGQMIEYWYYTGDTTYNDVVSQGLLFQVGQNNDYMPQNQTKDEGNDDQVFWAYAAMSAAELHFPNPPSSQPSWLSLAQAVFNEQVGRWDTSTCGGGLRWQIYTFNQGYDYKNTIATGGFFQLAARLARYTGNTTYADWADKSWNWMAASPLMTPTYTVYDGSATANNCSDASEILWTYNIGTMLMGSAYMFNYTNGSTIWQTRTAGLLNATQVFFPSQYGGNIMSEIACEPQNPETCDNDQPSFKAYLARWMAATTQMAPFTFAQIQPKLKASATAAAQQCVGGTNGQTCGRRWYQSTWDGYSGVGEQMSALSVVQGNLIQQVQAPVTADTGGTSQGNPSAGSTTTPNTDPVLTKDISTGDRAGAGILTFLALALLLTSMLWIIF